MLDEIESARETLNNLNNTYLARVSIEVAEASNRMNVVMKKFNAIATILLPMTVVTGLWGMNVAVRLFLLFIRVPLADEPHFRVRTGARTSRRGSPTPHGLVFWHPWWHGTLCCISNYNFPKDPMAVNKACTSENLGLPFVLVFVLLAIGQSYNNRVPHCITATHTTINGVFQHIVVVCCFAESFAHNSQSHD
jgi:hypothetical protein